jgi:hypothetical protein
MQVSRLIDPDWLVEIEADAVLDDGADPSSPRSEAPATHDARD